MPDEKIVFLLFLMTLALSGTKTQIQPHRWKKNSAMDFDGHSVYIRSLEIRKAAGRRIRAGMAAVRAMLFQKGFLHDQRSCVAEKKEIDQG